jgi:iron-sulfur cluster assembly protein
MIKLTETAAKKILENLAKRGRGIGIRVGTRTTGCSGLTYTLEYVDNTVGLRKDEQICHSNPVLIVDDKSMVYMAGMTIDYVKKGLNEGFEFINPNERARCGCGESFTV